MYPDNVGPSFNSAMAIRSQFDPHRSLPGTPLGIDPRTMSQSDISLAMNQARMSLEVPDYFNAAGNVGPRFNGNLRSRSPYAGDFEPEGFSPYNSVGGLPDMISR